MKNLFTKNVFSKNEKFIFFNNGELHESVTEQIAQTAKDNTEISKEDLTAKAQEACQKNSENINNLADSKNLSADDQKEVQVALIQFLIEELNNTRDTNQDGKLDINDYELTATEDNLQAILGAATNAFKIHPHKVKQNERLLNIVYNFDKLAATAYRGSNNLNSKIKLSKEQHAEKTININDNTIINFPNDKQFTLKEVSKSDFFKENSKCQLKPNQFISLKGHGNNTEVFITDEEPKEEAPIKLTETGEATKLTMKLSTLEQTQAVKKITEITEEIDELLENDSIDEDEKSKLTILKTTADNLKDNPDTITPDSFGELLKKFKNLKSNIKENKLEKEKKPANDKLSQIKNNIDNLNKEKRDLPAQAKNLLQNLKTRAIELEDQFKTIKASDTNQLTQINTNINALSTQTNLIIDSLKNTYKTEKEMQTEHIKSFKKSCEKNTDMFPGVQKQQIKNRDAFFKKVIEICNKENVLPPKKMSEFDLDKFDYSAWWQPSNISFWSSKARENNPDLANKSQQVVYRIREWANKQKN